MAELKAGDTIARDSLHGGEAVEWRGAEILEIGKLEPSPEVARHDSGAHVRRRADKPVERVGEVLQPRAAQRPGALAVPAEREHKVVGSPSARAGGARRGAAPPRANAVERAALRAAAPEAQRAQHRLLGLGIAARIGPDERSQARVVFASEALRQTAERPHSHGEEGSATRRERDSRRVEVDQRERPGSAHGVRRDEVLRM